MVERAPVPASDHREDRILEALADPTMRAILLALNERAQPAPVIESELRMPHSSLYRKIHELKALGLLGVERVEITPQGKRVELLRALVSKVTVEMDGGRLSVRAMFRSLAEERARTMWSAIREEVRR
ncbi:MAG: helix-turn-helix transcriptional regulator [Euryarchaeota archaeon]|nr:helix-turn-helix transcriptional regulator [Euryarchaeota archaeon]MDE1881352.1 helix-turn-helix transcriptional regulator [Euryarchaeota archaeon]MDE2045289.1 helix-turn-helix transcriptional regulator [Thermoplasmata archaeon]